MGFARDQEIEEKLRIIRAHRTADRSARRKVRAPVRDLRLLRQDAEIIDGVEDVEIAKHRPENGIDERELRAVEPGAAIEALLYPGKALAKKLALRLERGLGRSGVEAPDVAQDRRAELDRGAVLGALQRVLRMQGLLLRLLEIFEDNGGFENGRDADLEDRGLAQRRERLEPIGLVRKIDIDALERNLFFGERDHRALHIRAELVADEEKRAGHGHSNLSCVQGVTPDVRSKLHPAAGKVGVPGFPGGEACASFV